MGCMQSTATQAVPVPEQPEKQEKPRPRIFAIMRNGHEVIRGVQRDLKELIEKDDYDGALELWKKHMKWMFVHMTMEDGNGSEGSPMGMFKLLNEKFDGAADEAKLSESHAILHTMEEAVEEAFKEKNMEKLKAAFSEYDTENLDHLVKEEDVMMPKVAQMQKDGHPLKKYMTEEILATVIDSPDFEFFIKFGNQILEKHPQGQPRVRVWDHALWAVATEEQWVVWDAWIKETLKPESYQELQDAIKA